MADGWPSSSSTFQQAGSQPERLRTSDEASSRAIERVNSGVNFATAVQQALAKSPFNIDDYRAQAIRQKCGKFRILIIGRANAGKTTILHRTCNTTANPVIYNRQGEEIPLSVLESSAQRGIHDINNEMVFKSNTGFSFHDSPGFEAGGIDELERVKAFISSRSTEMKLEDQLHAIWYAIPVDDSRPFTAAEHWFFAECGTGSVPVIAIFTKFDALDNKAYASLIDQGQSRRDARRLAPQYAVQDFENVHLKTLYKQRYPPKAHVHLRDMNQEGSTCIQLIETTAAALNNDVLQQLFVSTQRNSLKICIKYAIEKAAMPVFSYHCNGPIIQSNKFKYTAKAVMSWFPQYKDHVYGHDDISLDGIHGVAYAIAADYGGAGDMDFTAQAANKLYSRLFSQSVDIDPLQKLVQLGITTAIVADFEYLIWNAHYKDSLTKALSIYGKHARTQAIVQSVDEALQSFYGHKSNEKLSHQMHEITLENRLTLELLNDPIVTK